MKDKYFLQKVRDIVDGKCNDSIYDVLDELTESLMAREVSSSVFIQANTELTPMLYEECV